MTIDISILGTDGLFFVYPERHYHLYQQDPNDSMSNMDGSGLQKGSVIKASRRNLCSLETTISIKPNWDDHKRKRLRRFRNVFKVYFDHKSISLFYIFYLLNLFHLF